MIKKEFLLKHALGGFEYPLLLAMIEGDSLTIPQIEIISSSYLLPSHIATYLMYYRKMCQFATKFIRLYYSPELAADVYSRFFSDKPIVTSLPFKPPVIPQDKNGMVQVHLRDLGEKNRQFRGDPEDVYIAWGQEFLYVIRDHYIGDESFSVMMQKVFDDLV